jgi:hypothetical protein
MVVIMKKSSRIWRCVVSYKLTDVSEVFMVTIVKHIQNVRQLREYSAQQLFTWKIFLRKNMCNLIKLHQDHWAYKA